LKNLTEAVERAFQSRQTYLHSAAEVVRQAQISASDIIIGSGATTMLSSRSGAICQQNRARRYGRYVEVVKLRQQGVSILGIAQALRMSRMRVYRYLNAECFPERVSSKERSSKLKNYLPYIHRRWAEGCHNATQVWREVAGQGYQGKPAMVQRYVKRLRVRVGALLETEQVKLQRLKSAFQTPSTKHAAHLLLKEGKRLSAEEELFIEQLLRLCPEVGQIKGLGQSFQKMVRERDVKQLDEWLGTAKGSGIKEMTNFAEGLSKDKEAVAGALSSEWSNGQTEGQINRLKLMKRQMYGRAKFDLLRARVLYAG
jgi:transposase